MRAPTGDGPLASAPAVARLQGRLCRGSLTVYYGRPPSRNAMRHATASSRANRCINAASPASNHLHHLHQACITCIRPESPASRVHQPHHACITPGDLGDVAPRAPTWQCFSVVSIIGAWRHCLQVFDGTALVVRAPRGGDHGCNKRNIRNFGERAALAQGQVGQGRQKKTAKRK